MMCWRNGFGPAKVNRQLSQDAPDVHNASLVGFRVVKSRKVQLAFAGFDSP